MGAVLGAVLGMALLTGCSGGGSGDAGARRSATSTSATSPTAAPAPPPAPGRTSCYDLSYTEAVAPTSDQAAVACTARHTSQTFLVARLQTVYGGHLVAVDSARVQQQVADTCPRRLTAYLGATTEQLRLSMLHAVWFTPTVAQSDAGASWYRCDVVAAGGDQQLARLTGARLKGALASATTRSQYAMCATDRPGAADFQRVLCRQAHRWRAVRSVDLAALAAPAGGFPGLAAVKAGGEQDGDNLCADAARAIAPDALDYQWGYEWPTADQWLAGQTYGRCWAPDTGS